MASTACDTDATSRAGHSALGLDPDADVQSTPVEPLVQPKAAAGDEGAFYNESDFRIEWMDVMPGEDVALADPVTTVRLASQSDEDVTMVLSLVGDYGTTRTLTLPIGEVVVAAGTTVEVPVDISVLFKNKAMTHAGRAHVAAVIQTDGEVTEQVVGGALFYHPSADGVLLYDERRMIDAHGAGALFEPFSDGASSAGADEGSTEESDNGAVARVVAFEPSSAANPNGVDLTVEPTSQASRQPDRTDLTASQITPGGSYQHKLCVRLLVQTVDSGFASSSGQTEDVWPNANTPEEHKANNIRVKVGNTALTTNSSGCVTFNSSSISMTEDVRVWARAERSNGTYVRIHDRIATTTASYPGSTRFWLVEDVFFSSLSTVPTEVVAGNASERATLMGALARSMHRYSDALAAGTEIHVAEDDTGIYPTSVAYFNDFTNNEAYLSILTTGGQRRSKFLVAHEYGHAYLHQYANSGTPNDDAGLASVGPGCENQNPGYDSHSEEWSSTAFTEGFAHFVSARVWNHNAANGWFNFGGQQRSELEKFNSTNDPGGEMVNECCEGIASCTPARDGHAVIFDWMRALWDIHSGGGGCSLSRQELASFFSLIVNANPASDGYYAASEVAAFWFGGACGSYWEQLSCHNGINMDGSTWGTPC